MKNYFMVSVFLSLILISFSCNADSQVSGKYRSITESEWNVYLYLAEDGSGQLKLEQWEPGEYSSKSVQLMDLEWIEKEGQVEVSYDLIQETFQYGEVSLQELGLEGSAIGLKPVGKTSEKSKIKGQILWREPISFFE